jgi:hypothetical protein
MRLVKHCLVIMALLLMHAGGRVRTGLDSISGLNQLLD